MKISFTAFCLSFLFICSAAAGNIYKIPLTTATDLQYPDNNQIGFKSKHAGTYTHDTLLLEEYVPGWFYATILPGNTSSDTIKIKSINVLEMMPTIPVYAKSDAYLSYLAVMNQEWNRVQVRYSNRYYSAVGNGTEDKILTRIDIANNCLAKGLWEILAYTFEDEKVKLYFQCWFTFPEELYNKLFMMRNGVSIDTYDHMLKFYDESEAQMVNLNVLRKVNAKQQLKYENLNNELYPLKGDRQTKAKNILYPRVFTSINDFLSDSTKYASFLAPGQYTKVEPRNTVLSRFQKLDSMQLLLTTSNNTLATPTFELHLFFTDNENADPSELIIGGMQQGKIPILDVLDLNNGDQRPMGIANHTYNPTVNELNNTSSTLENPYFSFLLDNRGYWLDSHEMGIDGSLFFREKDYPDRVHLLLLSYERHSFVGHYVFELPIMQGE